VQNLIDEFNKAIAHHVKYEYSIFVLNKVLIAQICRIGKNTKKSKPKIKIPIP
jgi:hypothetical protein